MTHEVSVPPPPPPIKKLPKGVTPSPARKKNRRRILLLAAVLLLIMCSVYLWSTYLITHKPITENLPYSPVVAQVIQPHFLFSIHDVGSPLGVAVSPDGKRIYATESSGARMIRAFDRDGKPLGAFAPPTFNATTSAPLSIVLDNKGRVMVSDGLRHTIDIYDAGGNYKNSIPTPLEEGWVPIGLRMDGNNLLVVNRTDKAPIVLQVTMDGQVLSQFGKEGPNQEPGEGAPEDFYQPDTAIRDKQGRIYVSDSVNQRVAVFSKGRNFLYSIDGLSLPRGMAIDEDQKLYVADAIGQAIWVYDVSGDRPKELFKFGDFGMGDGEFNYPNDIALDGTGRLYVADRASNRIQVWTY